MLDHGGREWMPSPGQPLTAALSPPSQGCMMFEARAQTPSQLQHRKTTVKELLLLRRQKWSYEPKAKSPKYEPVAMDTSPQTATSPSAAYSNPASEFVPALPENALMALPPPLPPSPPDQQGAAAAGGRMTLFHWQIQQEARKAEGLTPETLAMQDSDGDTFLHIAVAQGRRALSYVLAAKMAACGSLDTKEHNGQTALHIAAATNQHLIVGDLLTHGARVNVRDLWGRCPLHVCAEKGHALSLQSIWKVLAGRGRSVDVEMFNYDGLTPLHTAVLAHNAVLKEARLLENPCPFILSDLALRRRRYLDCIRTLMHMGASYGTRDLRSGRTCLHMAAEEANVELLHLLLEQPTSLAAINVKTFSGNTPLHIVSALQSYRNQADAVKLLMRKGADPGTRNFENELPCQLAPEGPVGEKVRRILKGKSGPV